MALFSELRGKMVAEDMNSEKLARRVGVTRQHINNILGGRTQPRLDLCYDILTELGEQPDKLHFYFPPKGVRVAAPQPQQGRNKLNVIRVGKAG
jgi:DNA-binding XRE family transcriptional regulator